MAANYLAFFDFTSTANQYQDRNASTSVTTAGQRIGRINDPVSGLALSETDGDDVRFTLRHDGERFYGESAGFQYLEDGNHGAWFDTKMNNRDPWWFCATVRLDTLDGIATLLTKYHATDPNREVEVSFHTDAGNVRVRTRRETESNLAAGIHVNEALTQNVCISGGYDGNEMTIRVNLGPVAAQADANSLPDTSEYNSAWIGAGGDGLSTTRFYAVAFMDHYPNEQEEEEAIIEVAAKGGIQLGDPPQEPDLPIQATSSTKVALLDEDHLTLATESGDTILVSVPWITTDATLTSIASAVFPIADSRVTINTAAVTISSHSLTGAGAYADLFTSSFISANGTSEVKGSATLLTDAATIHATDEAVLLPVTGTTESRTYLTSEDGEPLSYLTDELGNYLTDEHGNYLTDLPSDAFTDESGRLIRFLMPWFSTFDATISSEVEVTDGVSAVSNLVTGGATIIGTGTVADPSASPASSVIETDPATITSEATSIAYGEVTGQLFSTQVLTDEHGTPIVDEYGELIYVLVPFLTTQEATLFATGTHITDNSVVIYTANATISATATNFSSGVFTTFTDPATFSAQAVIGDGTRVSIHTDPATVSAEASVEVSAVSILDLDGATIDALSQLAILATATIDTDDATITSGTSNPISAHTSIETAPAVITAAARVGIHAQASLDLDDATIKSASDQGRYGSSNIATDDSSIQSSGVVLVQAYTPLYPDDATIQAEADRGLYALASIITDAATITSTADFGRYAALTSITEAATVQAEGAVEVKASSLLTTSATLTAVSELGREGYTNLLTDNATTQAEGTVDVTGAGSVLGTVSISAHGNPEVHAEFTTLTIDARIFANTELGAPPAYADFQTLTYCFFTSWGQVDVTAEGSLLAEASVSAHSSLVAEAEFSATTDDATITATGNPEVLATFTVNTNDAFIQSTAESTVASTGGINTSPVLLLATARVEVQATFSPTTDDALLNAAGDDSYWPMAFVEINTANATMSSGSRTRRFTITSETFQVFDGMYQIDKPVLPEFRPVNVIPVLQATGPFGNNVPTPAFMQSLFDSLPTADINTIDLPWPPSQQEGADRVLTYAKRAHEVTDETPLSFTLLVPSTYDNATSNNQQERRVWRALNTLPRDVGILRYVDVLTPTFVAVEPDVADWIKRVRRSVEECRAVAPAHPIYPLVWYRYADHAAPDLRNTLIPTSHWRIMLETLYQVCDGVVLWSPNTDTWEEQQPWWNETRDFLLDSRLALIG